MVTDDARLLGLWRTDPTDSRSLQQYGDVSLRFYPGGRLVYTVHTADRQQIMYLTYRIEGNWLVTDQLSAPREERTAFFFTPDGRLSLENPHPLPPTCYVRMSPELDPVTGNHGCPGTGPLACQED
jgi:hypothetical protein